MLPVHGQGENEPNELDPEGMNGRSGIKNKEVKHQRKPQSSQLYRWDGIHE